MAGLAIFVQKLAVAVVGFLLGGYGAVTALGPQAAAWGLPEWLLFVLAGLLAAFLARFLFEWTLIAPSVLLGTALLLAAAQATWLTLATPTTLLTAFLALACLGAAVQLAAGKGKGKGRKGEG